MQQIYITLPQVFCFVFSFLINKRDAMHLDDAISALVLNPRYEAITVCGREKEDLDKTNEWSAWLKQPA